MIGHILRTLERVTRPPRRPWGDLDTPLAEAEESRECWDADELKLVGPPSSLDDVVAQLAQISYYTEDIRNLLAQWPTDRSEALGRYFAGAAASLADGSSSDPSQDLLNPSVREDKQRDTSSPRSVGVLQPAGPQHKHAAATTETSAAASPAAGDPPASPAAGLPSLDDAPPLTPSVFEIAEWTSDAARFIGGLSEDVAGKVAASVALRVVDAIKQQQPE